MHDNNPIFRQTVNTTAISEAELVDQWARHTEGGSINFDTELIQLPLNWTRLYDGRIVMEANVLYKNGSAYRLVEGEGLEFREDFEDTLTKAIREIKFYEEE